MGNCNYVETKRDRNRRTITLPKICMSALWRHRGRQREEHKAAAESWKKIPASFFTTTVGTPHSTGRLIYPPLSEGAKERKTSRICASTICATHAPRCSSPKVYIRDL